MILKKYKIITLIILALFLSSCAGMDIQRNETDIKKEKDAADGKTVGGRSDNDKNSDGLFNDVLDSLTFGSGGENFGFGGSISFGAALAKVNFMPLASVDSESGIIITEWYNISSSEKRIKMNIQIFNDDMNDDSISVHLFEQEFDGSKWVDIGNNVELADKIKSSILEESRLLKTTADLS